MLEINYIATGGYIQYCALFCETINNFFPNEQKILRIITDCDYRCDYDFNGDVEVEVVRLFDLIYPCINLNKTYILSQLPATKAEYVFYFDADTFFNEMPSDFWGWFKNEMDNNRFCIGKHPFYNLSDEDEFKARDIEIFFSDMTERMYNQSSYIDSYYYTYVISSFFCAKRSVFYDICDRITSMIRMDMTRNNRYRIPLYMDENYFNKMVYEYEYKDNNEYIFCVNDFIVLGDSLNKEETPYAFITQKNYNKEYKINRR